MINMTMGVMYQRAVSLAARRVMSAWSASWGRAGTTETRQQVEGEQNGDVTNGRDPGPGRDGEGCHVYPAASIGYRARLSAYRGRPGPGVAEDDPL